MESSKRLWFLLLILLILLEFDDGTLVAGKKKCANCVEKDEQSCPADRNEVNCEESRKFEDKLASRLGLDPESRGSVYRRRKRDAEDDPDYVCVKFVGEFSYGGKQENLVVRRCAEEDVFPDKEGGHQLTNEAMDAGIMFNGVVYTAAPRTAAISSITVAISFILVIITGNLALIH